MVGQIIMLEENMSAWKYLELDSDYHDFEIEVEDMNRDIQNRKYHYSIKWREKTPDKKEHIMNNEWKELDIGNLPSDWLKGKYEIEIWVGNALDQYMTFNETPYKAIARVLYNGAKIRYRKVQPKSPTHEEIMSKYFKNDNGIWHKITAYNPRNHNYWLVSMWVNKDYFADMESADIPLEK